jgi:hypothetical protein
MKERIKINKNFLFVSAVLLVANLLTHGPDVIRAINCPEGKWYGGHASWFDPWDINFYSSVIGMGEKGDLLFQNPYDTQISPGIPVYTLYIITGKMTALLKLDNVLAFHLSAVIASLVLAYVAWWFLKIFLSEEDDRWVAFILLFLGGGLGWLFFPRRIPSDLGHPLFTFAAALQRPHEAISLALELATLGIFWQGVISQRIKSVFWGGIWFFLMLFFHPYNALSTGVILGLFGFYWGLKTDSFDFLKILMLTVGEVGIYFLFIGKSLFVNSTFSGVIFQSQFSDSILDSVIGWGVLFPLILAAFFSKEKSNQWVFFLLWFVSGWLITYLPVGFQRSLVRGLWVPAVILATMGAREIARRLKWDYLLLMIFIILFSSFSVFFTTFKRIAESPENRWIYLTKEEGEIIGYLRSHGNNGEGILASYRIANVLPAHTNKRVYLAHGFESPRAEERAEEVYSFFAGKMTGEEAVAFFKKANITYAFWGPEERAIARLTEIPGKSLMELVLEKQTVSLYKVKLGN